MSPFKFTLDTNCLIAIDEKRLEASDVRRLADGHAAGSADVAVVAISASENQKGGRLIQNFSEFQIRLEALGLSHLSILKPMAYLDVAFFDWALWADDTTVERQIHAILFPGVEFAWRDFCRVNGIDPIPQHATGRWRNCKCDVQALWSHIHHGRDVFVTSDAKFHAASKRADLAKLGVGRIEYPRDAVALLHK